MAAVLTPIRADIALRPPGHGKGLDGPACPDRVDDPYTTGSRWRGCILCGRVTPRRDWAPWCGGQVPVRPVPATIPLRNERTQGVCELCGEAARIFPTGWRCTACRPQPTGGAA